MAPSRVISKPPIPIPTVIWLAPLGLDVVALADGAEEPDADGEPVADPVLYSLVQVIFEGMVALDARVTSAHYNKS